MRSPTRLGRRWGRAERGATSFAACKTYLALHPSSHGQRATQGRLAAGERAGAVMAKWRRGGRPRKAAEDRRTERVALYLTPAERAELERRTAMTGWRDVGAYVRRAIMAQRSPRATVPQVNIQAWGELARTAANLNQLTRHLNEGGALDAATAARLGVELERLGGEVRALRLGLLGIKGEESSP
jgi:hypothetical protein